MLKQAVADKKKAIDKDNFVGEKYYKGSSDIVMHKNGHVIRTSFKNNACPPDLQDFQ